MQKDPLQSQRPPLLSILVIVGLIGCFLKMIMIISPPIQAMGRGYALYLSLSTVVLIVCLCGLWLMKRWGLFLFVPYVLMDQSVYWYLGLWKPISAVLMGSLLVVGLIHYRRFSR